MDDLRPDKEARFFGGSGQSMRQVLDRLSHCGQSGPGCTVDCEATLDRLEGDWELFGDLLGFFFEDASDLKDAILTAIADDDPVRLSETAHKFRGFISNFGAQRLEALALQLEQAGLAGHLRGAMQVGGQLEHELDAVHAVLLQFRGPD